MYNFRESKNLLTAINMLINIPGSEPEYGPIISDDVSDLYFKVYFTLTLKNPVETQFNIWNNYTNLNKLNSESFHKILLEFFNPNKCEYLHFKIKEFIGIDSHETLEGNYYVEINSLMMYVLEVYTLEKKNYYDSYCGLIDFLGEGQEIDLDCFVFLLDLLCFEENDQKKLLSELFQNNPLGRKRDSSFHNPGFCRKDHFYRLCIKYELPLFELVRILKFEQYKRLHDHIQNEYVEINAIDKWESVKQSLQNKLRSRAKFSSSFSKIISKLDQYIRGGSRSHNDEFSFLYRMVVHAAFF